MAETGPLLFGSDPVDGGLLCLLPGEVGEAGREDYLMARYCVHAGGKIEILECQFWVTGTGTLHVQTDDGHIREWDMDDWSVVHPLYHKVKGCPNSPKETECQKDDTPPLLD